MKNKTGKLGLPTSMFPLSHHEIQVAYLCADLPALTDLKRRLTADHRFQAINGSYLNHGTGYGLLQEIHLTSWWLWRANAVGVTQADEDLDRFLGADTNTIWFTEWLYGPEVQRRTKIAPSIYLVPPHEMPASLERDIILATQPGGPAYGGTTAGFLDMPSCALIQEVQVSKLVELSSLSTVSTTEKANLSGLALLLNATPGVSASVAYSTSYFPDCCPPGTWGGSGGGIPMKDVSLSQRTPFREADDVTFVALADAFNAKSPEEKIRIGRALTRLGSAKGRHDPYNAALELGMSLELLLLNDLSKGAPIAQNIRLRGAWLLGSDVENRIVLDKGFKDIYDLRSDVAHTGTSKKIQTGKPFATQFPEHIDLAERVARKLILNPTPNWATLVLGHIGD